MAPRVRADGLDYSAFRKRVKERDLAPLYLFVGEEVYLQERALRLLYETLDESGLAFNLDLHSIGAESPSGARTTAASVIDAANQLPMMSARRIVVARDFEKLKDHDQELILSYLQRPSPTTILVFQAVSLDQRKKLTTALLQACSVVRFDPLTEAEARKWAEAYAKAKGATTQPRVLEELVRLVGTSLSMLVNELEKLIAWAGNEQITIQAVQDLVPRAREHTSWELWDSILKADRRRSLRLIERLLSDGDSGTPLLVLGAIASLYRKMLIGKELMERGAAAGEVAKATGQYGPRASTFNSWVSRTPREQIARGLRRIAEVDNAIKNSEGTPRLQMEYLIAELTGGPGGAASVRKTSR
ncbi:MAG TPA: DNA polymerase III subunit delta [Blastocatellia bacterium]|nr:DNA polymerase III subunit delta [Blastocatellia bacterium]